MENDIFFLVNILNDNNFIKKVDEEFDKKVSDLLDTDNLDEEISVKHTGNPFYLEINGYSDPSELENYFIDSFSNFKRAAADSRLDKNKILQNEIIQRVFSIRTELEQLKLVSINPRYKNYIPLINIKIEYCDKTISFLSNIKTETLKLLGKQKSNSSLTQKQVVILFHHMHKLGYVGKGLTTDDLAIILSEMTGFSSTKLRQDLSHVKTESSSVDSEEFKDTDYIVIKRSLKKLIENIDQDHKDKFPPGS